MVKNLIYHFLTGYLRIVDFLKSVQGLKFSVNVTYLNKSLSTSNYEGNGGTKGDRLRNQEVETGRDDDGSAEDPVGRIHGRQESCRDLSE